MLCACMLVCLYACHLQTKTWVRPVALSEFTDGGFQHVCLTLGSRLTPLSQHSTDGRDGGGGYMQS